MNPINHERFGTTYSIIAVNPTPVLNFTILVYYHLKSSLLAGGKWTQLLLLLSKRRKMWIAKLPSGQITWYFHSWGGALWYAGTVAGKNICLTPSALIMGKIILDAPWRQEVCRVTKMIPKSVEKLIIEKGTVQLTELYSERLGYIAFCFRRRFSYQLKERT